MGSMNSNNWLSFPLSPTHSSIPAHLQTAQSHHFSLGLVNENIDNPFQNQGMLLELRLLLFSIYWVCEFAGVSMIFYIFFEQSGI